MMKFLLMITVCLLNALAVAAPASALKAPNVAVVGWVERIHIDDINASFPAKLDTGAKTSSIDAEIMKLIEPKEEKEGEYGYVVFSVKDGDEKPFILKRKIKRWVRIKKKALKSGFVRRPVVKMSFCIADNLVEEEVNLADRDDFIYPVLVGRNMLAKANLAVNASKSFTAKPSCKEIK